ncbi:MAG TPA: FAD-binding protein, partial [bacterium]|nr:FAD-binding protein [bacterium]
MKKTGLKILPGLKVDCYRCQHLVVGSGAAGLNCALYLAEAGKDVAIVTSRLLGGTSYNSGSDKQTYYKMSLFGDTEDSPISMARALFEGGGMDGDLAYIESLGSLPAFFRLVEKGVPFPANEYGAFVGYKTDHDPRQRATSAGPKTSRFMVEVLLREVKRLGVPIFDEISVVKLVTVGKRRKKIVGLVGMERKKVTGRSSGIVVFEAEAVILATGGPGELYANSVYPAGQVSLHGVALEAGVEAVNLGESQFGLASTSFRWNLSGTYQQVIPSYFSCEEGGRRHNFLKNWYRHLGEMASNIFLKGYQWPFSAERVANFGSSLIDLAVYFEKKEGRAVMMDFTENPCSQGEEFSLALLSGEALTYLKRSGALQETPYLRLRRMNPQAIEIYREHGIDLKRPLCVDVCFQHNNGGLAVDTSWQTAISGLFAIGELAGTHGVRRPGGAALNSGQVGAARAAKYLLELSRSTGEEEVTGLLRQAAGQVWRESQRMVSQRGLQHQIVRKEIQQRMSQAAGFLRYPSLVAEALKQARKLLREIENRGLSAKKSQLVTAWET